MSHKKNNIPTSRGQVMMIMVTLSLVVGLLIVVGGGTATSRDAQVAREFFASRQAFAVVESGEEDVAYRIKKAWNYQSPEVLTVDGFTATTTITDNPTTGLRQVRSTSTAGVLGDIYRKKSLDMVRGDNITFNYGVQVGNGGFTMANSSSVKGNVYSNGPISASGNYIYGTVVSAGASGSITSIHATGTAKAHTIQSSTIDKDAYYQIISNTTVSGVQYPGSSDPVLQTMPIADATIDEWEADAVAGGTISSPCPYVISNTTTIGPKKINCDLEIKGATVTLAGTVWVNGSIEFKNSSTIKVDPSFGRKSVVMIADKTTDRTNSSRITISNSTQFQNSGTSGSYVTLISRNRSAEDGGSVIAINLANSANGAVLLYTNHGRVSIGNSSQLREVTGYKIDMSNSAQVIYETGLENAVFDTGPGGTWNIYDWHEQ